MLCYAECHHYAESHYAEYHYTERHYAECCIFNCYADCLHTERRGADCRSAT